MKSKQEILAEVQESLRTGLITQDDIKTFVHPSTPQPVMSNTVKEPVSGKGKLSAVDVMFYIAGIVLYSAILSIIIQSWKETNALAHILLSAGTGVGLWAVAYYLIKSSSQNDIRKGLTNALLLTGSLSVITGGYIISNELIGDFNKVDFIPGAIMLAVLGGVHIGFDRFIKRDLTLLMGVLLSVASFPVLLFGFLQEADAPVYVWSIILIASAGLLAYATRIVAKVSHGRKNISSSFDSFAASIALISMYISSFGDYGILWLWMLIAAVFGIFYLSIISQSKELLSNASFFLVLTIITIVFKYFSGFGVTISLIVATLGLLGSAAIASSINKKYFRAKNMTGSYPSD